MKYCTCQTPKPLKNDADGVIFTVCAKSKGGCGEEISDNPFLVSLPEGCEIDPTKIIIDVSVPIRSFNIMIDLEDITLTKLGLSKHGPCQYAGCGKPGICSHQNTQYVNEISNYSTLCEEHQIEVDAYWEEMWKDYWSGRL